MFDTAKFGAFVAKLRKAADFTQSELGDRLGLTRQAISRYECGDSFPDISVLREIAAIFSIPLELLINSGDPTEGEAEIIDAVATGRDIKPRDPKDVVNLAPLLKPSILTKLSESMENQGIDMSHMLSLAEYLNETDAKKLMNKVSFDSLADMDVALLDKLLPLLGPYANEVILQKILDGELDYHYLELIGSYSDSLIESAVLYGAIDEDALNIMHRYFYNQSRMNRRGVIKLFTCPSCGAPLLHFFPRRCKCGLLPPVVDNVLRMQNSAPDVLLNATSADFSVINRRLGTNLMILMLGVVDFSASLDFCYNDPSDMSELILLDSDLDQLLQTERKIHSKAFGGLIFVHDDVHAPHIVPNTLDLIIDNTADHIAETPNLLALLKKGGSVVRGGQIVCEV